MRRPLVDCTLSHTSQVVDYCVADCRGWVEPDNDLHLSTAHVQDGRWDATVPDVGPNSVVEDPRRGIGQTKARQLHVGQTYSGCGTAGGDRPACYAEVQGNGLHDA